MAEHANDITVGEVIDGEVVIMVKGPLSARIDELACYVIKAHGVTRVNLDHDNAIIIASVNLTDERDTDEQIRIRIRNRCRDFISQTTGFISNIGPEGSYADLAEQAQPAPV